MDQWKTAVLSFLIVVSTGIAITMLLLINSEGRTNHTQNEQTIVTTKQSSSSRESIKSTEIIINEPDNGEVSGTMEEAQNNTENESEPIQQIKGMENPVWFDECVANGHDAFIVGAVHGHTTTFVCNDCENNEMIVNEETYPCLMEESLSLEGAGYELVGKQHGILYEFPGFIQCINDQHQTRGITNESTGNLMICDTCKNYYIFTKDSGK